MNYAIQIIENDAVIFGIGVPDVADPYKFIPRVIDELFTIWRTHVLPVRESEKSVIMSSSVICIINVCVFCNEPLMPPIVLPFTIYNIFLIIENWQGDIVYMFILIK